jgi:hypothetical protein
MGDFVGHYRDDAFVLHGFIRTRNVEFHTIDVPFPDATGTVALGVNNLGNIVGRCGPRDFPHARATFAAALNASHDVVGRFVAPDSTRGFLSRNGEFQQIYFLDAVEIEASGIADNGDYRGLLRARLAHHL